MISSLNVYHYHHSPISVTQLLWHASITHTYKLHVCSIIRQLFEFEICKYSSRLQANARDDITKIKPLTLWGYEGSPFVRPVRETLCSLGLRHVMVYCARGSQNRDVMFKKTGRFQVPYLDDPNTGVNMFESSAIVQYLQQVYTK